jgi:hypothetical protein
MATTKKRRIRRKKPGAEQRYYFTPDTQAAIVAFQASPSIDERHALYVTRIEPAFSALADNLIRINKYEGLFKSREELKHDCISFLYETLGKFDNSRGSSAFSYFNVVAKNWLTVCSRARATSAKKMVSIDVQGMHGPSDEASKTLRDKIVPSPDVGPDVPDLRSVLLALEAQRETFSAAEESCFCAILALCDDPEIVADAKKMHIIGALRGLSGNGRDFSVGMGKLRERYRQIRDHDDR